VIDRAEDGDGDAFRPARSGPVDAERAGPSSTDSPVTDDAPADAVRTDALLATAEQRAAASRRYQDTVDHTYDVARVEAAEDAGSESPAAPPSDAQPRGASASEEGGARDRDPDADAEPEGTDARDSEAESAEARDAEAPETESEAPAAEGPDGQGGAARDAWAEALPGLRAGWERHQQKYPERTRPTPSSQADGGWLADGGRKLSPEQNAEASKACEDIRAEGREVILPAMERVEAADQDRRLAGLEHMLKGEDRLKEKIADEMTAKPELTISKAMDTVVDPVRFTFAYSSQRYAEGTLSDVEQLKSEGFELVKLKNLWTDDQYKGINSQWRRPETGLRFEVQFHTPESLEAKELTHKAYERIRSTASPAERRELKGYQRQVNALLVTPPGTAEIKDFPEKR
jgi:hypothetical protein